MKRLFALIIPLALVIGFVGSAAAQPLNAPATQSPLPGAGPSTALPEGVLYFWDFEGNDGGFVGTLDWQWGTYGWTGAGCDPYQNYPPPAAYSGTDMWGTVLNGCYVNRGNNEGYATCTNTNPTNDSILSFTIDLTGIAEAELSWWEWYDLFSNWDWAEVYANGTQVFPHCEPNFVAPTAWVQRVVNLTPFVGGPVTIEFHMMASTVVNHAGWYIDDVMVTGEQPVAFEAWKEAPASAEPGATIGYTIVISATELVSGMAMTDTLPVGVEYAGNLAWSAGTAWYDGGDNAVYWEYTAPPRDAVAAQATISFDVIITAACGDLIVNEGIVTLGDEVRHFYANTDVVGDPNVVVTPTELHASLYPDATAVIPLEICNVGVCPLDWSVSEVVGVPWLSEEPTSGVVPPEECANVDVTFDSAGALPGDYTASLAVDSDDPETPLIIVPVTMTVVGYPVYLPVLMRTGP